MPPYEVDALWEILDLPLTYYILIKVMSSTMHWPYLGVIIVQKIPSESLQYNSTTVFMTCNEMAATVSCRHGSHTQVSTLPYPPTGQSPCISMPMIQKEPFSTRWITGVCIDTYVFYQCVLEKKTYESQLWSVCIAKRRNIITSCRRDIVTSDTSGLYDYPFI